MSTNKKAKHAKVKKTVEKIKKNDPHLEINDRDMPDPFSFGLNAVKQTIKAGDKFKKAVQKELPKKDAFKSLMNQDVAKGVKKTMDKYMNSSSNGIFNNSEAANAGTVFAERIINSVTSTISNALEKNSALSEDMLKCKDAKDCMSFQQKMFEVNFTNMMNFYMDVSFAVQALVSKNMQVASQYGEKNIKCMVGEVM
jgi:hypothetical protein